MYKVIMHALCFFWVVVEMVSPAAAKRVALVIGNDNYEQVAKLHKAVNDANAIAVTLEKSGFQVLKANNLARREMNRKLQAFASRLKAGDEALFFFAGHGVEIAGRNYLLPTDIPNAAPGQETFVTAEAVPVDQVLETIRNRGTRISILVLDACRDNPFPKTGTRNLGGSRGLARMPAPEGTFIMYSAGVGQTALDRLSDSDPNPNSVFTRNLIPLLQQPGLSLVQAARNVRRNVQTLASTVSHIQRPAYYDEVTGDFYFSGKGPARAASPSADEVASLRKELEALKGRLNVEKKTEAEPRVAVGVYPEQPSVADGVPTHDCDRLAAHSADPDRAAKGIYYDQLDARAAIKACREAVEKHPSTLRFHYQLGRALVKSKSYSEALDIFRMLVAKEHAPAMNSLGLMYRHGEGVTQDGAEAVKWYRKGAERGFAGAMFALGSMYQYGDAVIRDDVEALKWYRKGAEQEYSTAMVALGYMYDDGKGVTRDDVEAVKWYRKAADKGDSYGMHGLARMYDKGEGVAEDNTEAFKWFRKAADKGNKYAMNNLAAMYRKGEGVAQDDRAAFRWLRKAAEAGLPLVMNELVLMYRNLEGNSEDYSEAIKWFRKAANQKNPEAYYALSVAYGFGKGVAKDNRTAARYIIDAVKARNLSALNEMIGNADTWDEAFRRELQGLMRTEGVYSGAIDGKFGSGSKRAIEELWKKMPNR